MVDTGEGESVDQGNKGISGNLRDVLDEVVA